MLLIKQHIETKMNTQFFKLNNIIQDYAWGTFDALNSLFEIPNPSNKPQAEIWMGAHPNGCSKITFEGKEILLSDYIASDLNGILGERTAHLFGELPYLFKVLSAGNALSVQVHPSKEQAEIGFKKEESDGIPLSAAFRNYKDPNHKPELVYALTPYQAMNGFREHHEILQGLKPLHIKELDEILAKLEANQNEEGLSAFFESLLSFNEIQKSNSVSALVSYAKTHQDDELFQLILTLSEQYPGDIGLFSPLILNTLTLTPGEAMFLDACTPHAYIKGTGLEIMANSDNVLRAGLTPKHMDVVELIKCTRCKPISKETIRLEPEAENKNQHYPVPVTDFKFSVYKETDNTALMTNSAEILLAIDAELTLRHKEGETLTLKKGESVFIPAFVGEYFTHCKGSFARAYN